MVLTLKLTDKAETKLRHEAAASGTDVGVYVSRLIEQQLSRAEPLSPEELGIEQWCVLWRQWARDHARLPYEVDDSRETIYAGRGE
jgi:hypothetical protein